MKNWMNDWMNAWLMDWRISGWRSEWMIEWMHDWWIDGWKTEWTPAFNCKQAYSTFSSLNWIQFVNLKELSGWRRKFHSLSTKYSVSCALHDSNEQTMVMMMIVTSMATALMMLLLLLLMMIMIMMMMTELFKAIMEMVKLIVWRSHD